MTNNVCGHDRVVDSNQKFLLAVDVNSYFFVDNARKPVFNILWTRPNENVTQSALPSDLEFFGPCPNQSRATASPQMSQRFASRARC